MAWIVRDLVCTHCGHKLVGELYKNGEEAEVECPECGVLGGCVVDGISSPTLSTYEMADKDGKAEILMKRSAEHTKKQIMKDADKFGGHGMQRRHDYQTGKIK